MDDLNAFYGPNAGYVLDLYDRYRNDPQSVDAETRTFFENWSPPEPPPSANGDQLATRSPATDRRLATRAVTPDIARVVGAAALAQAIREYGHLAARLDPLGGRPPGDPELDAATHGIRDWDLAQ